MSPRKTVLNRSERGAATVEFALVAMIFFTVLFSIVDFSYLLFINLTMQHAVREGARYAVTGRADLDPTPDPSNPVQSRYDAAIEEMKESSMGFWDTVAPVVSFKYMSDAGTIVALPANSAGSASEILIISLHCTAATLTPFTRAFFATGNYQFDVSATMRTEAY